MMGAERSLDLTHPDIVQNYVLAGFSTHNQMYSQRYVRLTTACARPTFSAVGQVVTTCTAQVPQSRNVAPPSDYLLVILDAGVPSEAVFIGIGP